MLVSMPTLAPDGISSQSFQKVATTDKATARSPKRTPCLFIGFLLSGRQYHILQLSEPSPKTRTPARDAEALNGRVDSSFVIFYRGFGEFHEKEFDQASKDFDRAYELDPTLYTGIGKALSDSIQHRKEDGLDILNGLERRITARSRRSRGHVQDCRSVCCVGRQDVCHACAAHQR